VDFGALVTLNEAPAGRYAKIAKETLGNHRKIGISWDL